MFIYMEKQRNLLKFIKIIPYIYIKTFPQIDNNKAFIGNHGGGVMAKNDVGKLAAEQRKDRIEQTKKTIEEMNGQPAQKINARLMRNFGMKKDIIIEYILILKDNDEIEFKNSCIFCKKQKEVDKHDGNNEGRDKSLDTGRSENGKISIK